MARNRGRSRKESLKITVTELGEARAKRSDEEQAAALDERLGKGKGAKKERARLKRRIEDRKKPKVEKKGDEEVAPKKERKKQKREKGKK